MIVETTGVEIKGENIDVLHWKCGDRYWNRENGKSG